MSSLQLRVTGVVPFRVFTCVLLPACESAVTLLFDAVMHLGCKPYLDSQRDSCVCQYEVKQEL